MNDLQERVCGLFIGTQINKPIMLVGIESHSHGQGPGSLIANVALCRAINNLSTLFWKG